ncbi:MAG: glycoside hydrolase family 32 protein [Kiritimatiellaeota bacterium]|nr:glycoside hydrolase family 32 protein [Kiritimatiellota bacterium]
MDRGPDYTSRVPQYRFSDTLAAQETELSANPLLRRFRESRRRLAADPYRPLYHFVSPESSMNDPNGLCLWRGRWHLFYQAYPPEDPRQHWGHAVSPDLIHWQDLPYAVYPNPEEKCFSGATLVESDRVIAVYHGINAGTMVAVSNDPLLLNWKKVTGKAVIPLPQPGDDPLPYNIFDPCIWTHEGMYYALTAGTLPNGPAGKPVRAEFLHRSADLTSWEYLHPFLEDDHYGLVGDDGACPYFWPIGDLHILLHFSHMSGGKYLLGAYDAARGKFKVTDGGDFNFGPAAPCGVHAPSATPDGEGGVIVIFNMNPGKPTSGWDQIMSLPRRLTLGAGGFLCTTPAGDFASLRSDHRSVGKTALPANREIVFDAIRGNSLELVAEIDTSGAPVIELSVLRSPRREEYTRIAFFRDRGNAHRDRGRPDRRDSLVTLDSSHSSVLPDVACRAPETAPVFLEPEETLRLHVFIDRSIVEVFVNDKQCVALRVYPGREDSLGVSVTARGRDAQLVSLEAWQMQSASPSVSR